MRAVRRVAGDGAPDGSSAGAPAVLPERITVGRPPRPGEGDYATNAALRLAAAIGRPARSVAEELREVLVREADIAEVAVAGPGFLNITVARGARAALVAELAGRDDEHLVAASTEPASDVRHWFGATGGKPSWEQREGNPLFLVQYAHARARALLRGARALGLAPEAGAGGHAYDGPRESALVGALAECERIAGLDDPGRLARALTEVADALLDIHGAVLPVGERKPEAAHRARLALAQAAGAVLAGGLTRLGVTAPARL
nr:DALR anticodon-binding domain-containing protein [Streptomyces taklimakanensis]